MSLEGNVLALVDAGVPVDCDIDAGPIQVPVDAAPVDDAGCDAL
jgi:hypothetical protein